MGTKPKLLASKVRASGVNVFKDEKEPSKIKIIDSMIERFITWLMGNWALGHGQVRTDGLWPLGGNQQIKLYLKIQFHFSTLK